MCNILLTTLCFLFWFKGDTIQGSVRNPHIQHFKPKFEEGELYNIENFIVTSDVNNKKFKTYTHQYNFNFWGKTEVK